MASRKCLESLRRNLKRWIVICVPILLIPLPICLRSQTGNCAYGLLIMAVFWMTEALPLPVTSLIPIVIFPIMGITKVQDLAHLYYNDIIFVFIGAYSVAVCVEKWNIHRRFALRLLLSLGSEPKWLLLGFTVITSFLSMWMGNIAVCSTMIPMANAVLVQLIKTKQLRDRMKDGMKDLDTKDVKEEAFDFQSLPEGDKKICKAFSLCICYAANIGGIATLTGTAPNLVMKGNADMLAGGESGVTFASWIIFGMPVACVNTFICWIVLQLAFFGVRDLFCSKKKGKSSSGVQELIQKEYIKLGPMSFAEKAVLGHFVILVLLWFTREPEFFPGWASLFKEGFVRDAVPAILICISLFVFPSERRKSADSSTRGTRALLDWKTMNDTVPWGLCLLLGGGFALARACSDSGLSLWFADQLSVFKDVSPKVMILLICLLVSFSTEIIGNTPICSIFMPILADLAIAIHVHPIYLMLPAAIATSFAFMLPVATPPNSIVFGYGYLHVMDMVKVGFFINILCVLVVTLAINTYGIHYFDLDVFPDWAKRNVSSFVDNPTSNSTFQNLTDIISSHRNLSNI
ncbi:hypothetical protein FSP39_021163 [Pinctada imbricata]|uniref:Solute carrier family 13 member 5 n=1 Tax=Pinctada imbricata TaxID=66713 RepID=A0AA88XGI7_PINIB|nr:hypothetical protein FSP39_021163 [Pinctada imbricata]